MLLDYYLFTHLLSQLHNGCAVCVCVLQQCALYYGHCVRVCLCLFFFCSWIILGVFGFALDQFVAQNHLFIKIRNILIVSVGFKWHWHTRSGSGRGPEHNSYGVCLCVCVAVLLCCDWHYFLIQDWISFLMNSFHFNSFFATIQSQQPNK